MKDKYLTQKLVFAKYLYQKAISELSIGTDLAASVAVNLLHDSVEMVIIAIEEKCGLEYKEFALYKRINRIKKEIKPKLFPLEKQILGLNAARRNFKHEGQLQKYEVIQELSIFVLSFFERVCTEIFKLDFASISLATLIEDKKIKENIVSAENFISKKEYLESMIKSATAFELLKGVMYNELFRLGHYYNSREWEWPNSDLDMLGDITSSKIQESFKELYQFSTLSIFGVNLQKYIKFKLITPTVGLTGGDQSHVNLAETHFFNKDNQNFKTSNFCLDFVTELAIKVQSKLLNGLIDSWNN